MHYVYNTLECKKQKSGVEYTNTCFRINTSTVDITQKTNTVKALREKQLPLSLPSKCLSILFIGSINSKSSNKAYWEKSVQPIKHTKHLSLTSRSTLSLLAPSSDTNLLFVALGERVGLQRELGQHPLQPGQVVLELLLQILVFLVVVFLW